MATFPDLHKLIDSEASGEEARRLKIFAERLFEREPAESREWIGANQRLSIAKSAFEFFRIRSAEAAVHAIAASGKDAAMVLESATPDCPFIVDSVLECLHAVGAPVRMMLHPVFRVARDRDGAIAAFENATAAERSESFIHAELEVGASQEQADEISARVRRVLVEVHRATADFDAMTSRALAICDETAASRELVEIRDFLRWMVHGGFVFLGYRRYSVQASDGSRALVPDLQSGLGILAGYEGSRFSPPSPIDQFTAGEVELLFEGPPLTASKTPEESHVHRRRAMDSIMIRRTGAGGRAEFFDRFLGLYTSKAYAEEAEHVPVLRAKLKAVLEAEEVRPGSHDYKEVVAAFNSFPKDELFRASIADIRKQLKLILDHRGAAAVRLSVMPDPNRGHVIALVLMPRETFSAEVRVRIQQALERGLKGALIYYFLALGERYTARLHFCFAAKPPQPAAVRKLEAEIAELARTWDDRLREQLGHRFGATRGHELLSRWGLAFDPEYKAAVAVERAAADIEQIEKLLKEGGFGVELAPAPEHARAQGACELRMYALGEQPVLSDLMPVLQNFGVRVLSEDAHQVAPIVDGTPTPASIESFLVLGPEGAPLDKMPGVGALADAIAAVRAQKAENDPINALTLGAGLNWREVALVRAYLAAAFQMRLGPARPGIRRVFLNHPVLARILIELFKARLDPRPAGAAADPDAIKAQYLEHLAEVDNIADDRIARAVLAMIEATVRTNYFAADASYVTLKFESGRIAGLPDAVPLYEIHVNSPGMEGCHLRAGRVARGGIRFSDRPDDFRTEILDLMKTQTVKNAVIVPTGAKGGFIVKTAPGRQPDPNEVVDAYKTLMNAMLDITDNITDAGIVHPDGVKVLDSDLAYLVVAADKGTAAFSDIANEIAVARNFWLGDAFASGGKHGYDHKGMGITARGAWESARRHLREMGRDPMRGAPVTIAGIGDMSGDVFGNGLIYSNNVKLLAAFDHRHIFLDPDPDPPASFEERKRLFEKPRSSWADYDSALISAGGGVFPRGSKRIALSPQVRAALQIDAEALDGENLIRAILRAPVDMLYNGGIGTYVRASSETDADVGDHANDSCRIAANELRAKIVVEGGNLGFTQKARIEYALGGGRINTDAIDNSAGVDTSDHEVNLKILLEPPLKRGELTFEARNELLASCTDEIGERVLRDNRDQVLSLSLEQARTRTQASAFRDHMQAIEERGLLRRHEESLPTREVLRERRSRFPGLTRPELSVITAYTKIDLTMRLENSPLLEDPYLVDRFLKPYFPAAIAERFPAAVEHHRLRRQLVGTRIVNEMVDLMGSIFMFEMTRDHGVEADDAIRAWIIAAEILGLRAWAERLRQSVFLMDAEAEIEAFRSLERAGRVASEWTLINCRGGSVGEQVGGFRALFSSLASGFESLLGATERDRFERIYRELRATVNEEELAHGLARLAFSDHLLSVLSVSLANSVDPLSAARVYFSLGAALDFSTPETALSLITSEDHWERRAAREMAEELGRARNALCVYGLEHGNGAEAALERLKIERERQFQDAERLIAEMRAAPAVTVAALHVVVRSISRLAAIA